MVKVIVLAAAFTALVAFSTAHTTIVTTTIEDENPRSDFQIECFHSLKRNRFVQCQKYLQQDQKIYDNSRQQEQGLEPCCQELRNVQEKCQCQAVSKVFDDAKMDREKQGGQFGAQMIQQLKQMVQNLPNKCNLQTEQCQLGTVITTTTTITEEETYDNTRSRDSHQCSENIERQRFNQCQRYIAQQSSSPRTLLMKTDRPEQQSLQLKQCCNELQNVNRECQCEAMQEVYKKAKQQQQHQQHQGSQQHGGQQQQQQRELEQIREVVQNLRDECNLQVEQCRILSAMF